MMHGIDAVACEVEVHLSTHGLPQICVVGLPDAAIRESVERVRRAIEASGFEVPRHHVVINLAPAGTRKEGAVYDLPIAVGLLLAAGFAQPGAVTARDANDFLIAGELALDGRLRPVRAAVSAAVLARAQGRGVILPVDNALEAQLVPKVQAVGAATLGEVIEFLRGTWSPGDGSGAGGSGAGGREVARAAEDDRGPAALSPVDFREIKGQVLAKRAMLIAAAGCHNILMLGPAGCGKTMLARALCGIMPELHAEEALEVLRIESCVGVAQARNRVGNSLGHSLNIARPIRAPHHGASSVAIVGGGPCGRPGEITLAHQGVLFLDELPEFRRDVLESLREPLESGEVCISRAQGSVRWPAMALLVAAMNPAEGNGRSIASLGARGLHERMGKVSQPILDRIDLHVEVRRVSARDLSRLKPGCDSAGLREQVARARDHARARQGNKCNARLSARELDEYCRLDGTAADLLARGLDDLSMSARAYDKVRKVARTIADLAGARDVNSEFVAEALQYRTLGGG